MKSKRAAMRVPKSVYDLTHKIKELKHITMTDLIIKGFKSGTITEWKIDDKKLERPIKELEELNFTLNQIAKKFNEIDKSLRESFLTEVEAANFIEETFNDKFLSEIKSLDLSFTKVNNSLMEDGKTKLQYGHRKISLNDYFEKEEVMHEKL